MIYKIDLHTHSSASPDGGITRAQYQKVLHSGALDFIAVTDHNRISFASLLKKEFGDRIIIGEEIMTAAGEIVGLFLEEEIPAGLSPLEAVKRIKEQDGIVYIPHPFETVRKGLGGQVLDELADYIDLIEIYNGRAILKASRTEAAVWARLNNKTGVASSDAHGFYGLGKTYTRIHGVPTRENILELLGGGTPQLSSSGVRAVFYPKYNRLRKKLRLQK